MPMPMPMPGFLKKQKVKPMQKIEKIKNEPIQRAAVEIEMFQNPS